MLAAEARAVAAASVILRAEVRGSTQTWLFEEPAPMTIVVVAVYECSYLLTYLLTYILTRKKIFGGMLQTWCVPM